MRRAATASTRSASAPSLPLTDGIAQSSSVSVEQIGHGARVTTRRRARAGSRSAAACRAPRPRRGSAGSARTAARTCRPGTPCMRVPCTTTARSGMSPRATSSPVCGVDHRRRRREDHARAELGAPPHARAVDDHAARPDEAVVLDDDGHGLRRLEHAADADAAREVHALADLCARRRPSPTCRPSCPRRRTRRC